MRPPARPRAAATPCKECWVPSCATWVVRRRLAPGTRAAGAGRPPCTSIRAQVGCWRETRGPVGHAVSGTSMPCKSVARSLVLTSRPAMGPLSPSALREKGVLIVGCAPRDFACPTWPAAPPSCLRRKRHYCNTVPSAILQRVCAPWRCAHGAEGVRASVQPWQTLSHSGASLGDRRLRRRSRDSDAFLKTSLLQLCVLSL